MKINISDRMKDMSPSAVREIFKSLADPDVISFAGGNPSPKTFPAKELSQISERLFRDQSQVFMQYGITEGLPKLRELTKKRMSEKYSLMGSSDELIITSGGQQAIDLALKVLTNEGDCVICENPSFIGGLNDIRSYKTRLVGIPVDESGMDMDALEQALKTEKNVKLIYTIPTFQNPTGVTMTAERRKRMYELAVLYNVIILEDSPYFEIGFTDEMLPCIKSFDKTGHVIFCGSYSKVVSPGLRVGFLIANRDIMTKAVVAKQCSDVHTSILPQMLVAEYLENYDMDAHIQQCRDLYKNARDRMLRGLERHCGSRIEFTRPQGGLFIWCTLPKGLSGYDFCLKTGERKLVCVPGSAFDTGEDRSNCGFRLNYSMPSPEQIDTGTEIIGQCLDEFL